MKTVPRQELFEAGTIVNMNDQLKFSDEEFGQMDQSEESIGGQSERGYSTFFEDDTVTIPTVSMSQNSLIFDRCSTNGSIHSHHVQGKWSP